MLCLGSRAVLPSARRARANVHVTGNLCATRGARMQPGGVDGWSFALSPYRRQLGARVAAHGRTSMHGQRPNTRMYGQLGVHKTTENREPPWADRCHAFHRHGFQSPEDNRGPPFGASGRLLAAGSARRIRVRAPHAHCARLPRRAHVAPQAFSTPPAHTSALG
eukprot:249425-Chlamydomonas_euryale.AAC.4